MQENWSLILNTLLLIGVIIAIVHMIKSRRHPANYAKHTPVLYADNPQDEIIAVRKIERKETNEEMPLIKPIEHQEKRVAAPRQPEEITREDRGNAAAELMMFLLAKQNRQLAGYELLQTVLAAGLRFGEGHLFHRHQHINGKGPILCSLAAATASGVFDLQNIGAFSVRGLCLFMRISGNASIDEERFAIMLETGKKLSEGLDAHLLDDRKEPLSEESLKRYRRQMNISGCQTDCVRA